MSYILDDLDNVNAAITDFVNGDRVGEFRTAGQTVKYADVTLSELQEIKAKIVSSLRPKRSRYQKIYTDKGLG